MMHFCVALLQQRLCLSSDCELNDSIMDDEEWGSLSGSCTCLFTKLLCAIVSSFLALCSSDALRHLCWWHNTVNSSLDSVRTIKVALPSGPQILTKHVPLQRCFVSVRSSMYEQLILGKRHLHWQQTGTHSSAAWISQCYLQQVTLLFYTQFSRRKTIGLSLQD